MSSLVRHSSLFIGLKMGNRRLLPWLTVFSPKQFLDLKESIPYCRRGSWKVTSLMTLTCRCACLNTFIHLIYVHIYADAARAHTHSFLHTHI